MKAAYLLSHQKVSLSREDGTMPHGLPLSETAKNKSGFLSTHITFGPLYLVQIQMGKYFHHSQPL